MIIYKGYQIKPDKHNSKSLTIVTDGKGGKIPSVLEGIFTSASFAMGAIDAYLATKPVRRGKEDAEAVAES